MGVMSPSTVFTGPGLHRPGASQARGFTGPGIGYGIRIAHAFRHRSPDQPEITKANRPRASRGIVGRLLPSFHPKIHHLAPASHTHAWSTQVHTRHKTDIYPFLYLFCTCFCTPNPSQCVHLATSTRCVQHRTPLVPTGFIFIHGMLNFVRTNTELIYTPGVSETPSTPKLNEIPPKAHLMRCHIPIHCT